jgi:hypothetical protein
MIQYLGQRAHFGSVSFVMTWNGFFPSHLENEEVAAFGRGKGLIQRRNLSGTFGGLIRIHEDDRELF